jgi:hypothetical protein
MNKNASAHLDIQRIIAALVDEGDLTAQEREHLKVCPVCSASRRHLAAQLGCLSEEAMRFTPDPRKMVTLPATEVFRGSLWNRKWYTGLAAAAACLVLVISLSLPHLFTHNLRPYGKLTIVSEMAADEILITAIKDIEENGLPVSLQKIVPATGPADENDDLLDFVAPADA